MAVVLDAGAEDLVREGDAFEVVCDPSDFSAVLAALSAAGIDTLEAEVKHAAQDARPKSTWRRARRSSG